LHFKAIFKSHQTEWLTILETGLKTLMHLLHASKQFSLLKNGVEWRKNLFSQSFSTRLDCEMLSNVKCVNEPVEGWLYAEEDEAGKLHLRM